MKRVIRPGVPQYAYMLLGPAFLVFIGLATIGAGFSVVPPDWANRLAWGLGLTTAGLLFGAYVVGMRVEVDEVQATKVYLFGLMRETIPFSRMASDISTESDRYGSQIQYVNFATIDGRGAFTLLRGWVWPGQAVDDLLERAKHVDAPMRRQNRILSVFALGLQLSGLGIVLVAIVLFLVHLIFHWPS